MNIFYYFFFQSQDKVVHGVKNFDRGCFNSRKDFAFRYIRTFRMASLGRKKPLISNPLHLQLEGSDSKNGLIISWTRIRVEGTFQAKASLWSVIDRLAWASGNSEDFFRKFELFFMKSKFNMFLWDFVRHQYSSFCYITGISDVGHVGK